MQHKVVTARVHIERWKRACVWGQHSGKVVRVQSRLESRRVVRCKKRLLYLLYLRYVQYDRA